MSLKDAERVTREVQKAADDAATGLTMTLRQAREAMTEYCLPTLEIQGKLMLELLRMALVLEKGRACG